MGDIRLTLGAKNNNPQQHTHEISLPANRVLRYVRHRVRAADRVVGAELLVAGWRKLFNDGNEGSAIV